MLKDDNPHFLTADCSPCVIDLLKLATINCNFPILLTKIQHVLHVRSADLKF